MKRKLIEKLSFRNIIKSFYKSLQNRLSDLGSGSPSVVLGNPNPIPFTNAL
jgi:hypothetical protein